jgi:hypothetical protein
VSEREVLAGERTGTGPSPAAAATRLAGEHEATIVAAAHPRQQAREPAPRPFAITMPK